MFLTMSLYPVGLTCPGPYLLARQDHPGTIQVTLTPIVTGVSQGKKIEFSEAEAVNSGV